jgi:hypothetical protein
MYNQENNTHVNDNIINGNIIVKRIISRDLSTRNVTQSQNHDIPANILKELLR